MPRAETAEPKKRQKRSVVASEPAKETAGLAVEYLPLSELAQWPRNPKRHDIPGLKSAMARWGFTLPVMIDETSKRLVAGHGRQEALSEIKAAGEPAPKNIHVRDDGEWMVPVIRGNAFSSEAEAEKYLIADNRFVEVGGWDPGALLEMVRDFGADELSLLHFDDDALSRLAEDAFVDTLGTPTRAEAKERKDKSEREHVMFVASLSPSQNEVVFAAIRRCKSVTGAANNTEALVRIAERYMMETRA